MVTLDDCISNCTSYHPPLLRTLPLDSYPPSSIPSNFALFLNIYASSDCVWSQLCVILWCMHSRKLLLHCLSLQIYAQDFSYRVEKWWIEELMNSRDEVNTVNWLWIASNFIRNLKLCSIYLLLHSVHQSMTHSWLPAQPELAHMCKKYMLIHF